ncbi:MAG: ABC transporter permease, partial [Acidimicrobiales bacterium]
MFRLTLRNLNAFKIRLALTTFAVVLGVSFVVSSFVLTDGFRQSFSTLSSDIVADTDFEVQPTSDFGSVAPMPASTLGIVEGVDGVEHAAGQVFSDRLQPTTADGELLTSSGPPLLSSSWVDESTLNQFTLRDGRAPTGDEFAMEYRAAAEHGFEIGSVYEIVTPTGVRSLTLSGTTVFGDDSATMGALLMQYPLDTLQTMIDSEGLLDSITVSIANSSTMAEVRSGLEAALPDNVEVRDNAQLVADTNADFEQGINIINNVMLGFAIVSLFVSIFIIANTFAIVVGQRTSELALLRAIGATPPQVRRSTMAEALIIGVVASLLGLLAGLGITVGLQAIFNALGASLPDVPLVMRTRTIVIAMILGVGVTLASATGPARKASGIAPMQAMQASVEAPSTPSRRRSVLGLVVLAAGLATGWFGLFGSNGSVSNTVALLGVGAVLVFGAMALMAPALVRPIVSVLGLPVRTLGAAGKLSTQNAGRNPRRTASSAASLTVGLGLVTAALVVGQSIKTGISGLVDDSVTADVLIQADDVISPQAFDDVGSTGSFDQLGSYRYDEIKIGDDVEGVIGTNLATTAELFDVGVSAGAMTDAPNTVAVYRGVAEDRGLAVGDTVDVMFPSGVAETLTVGAIFDSKAILDLNWVINDNDWSDRFGSSDIVWAAGTFAAGVEDVDSLTVPGLTFENRAEYKEGVESDIDQMLV